jgi:hypothetical protein
MTTAAYFTFALILATLFLFKFGLTGVSVSVLAAFLMLAAIPWYFGTRNRSSPPSGLERVLASMWVWFRRILGLSMGVLMIVAGAYALFSEVGARGLPHRWLAAGLLIFLGLFLMYFAIVGQGHRRHDWRDDVALHKENKRRYRWRL